MHPLTVFQVVLIFLDLHATNGRSWRRIMNGTEVTESKRYVVYLAKAHISSKEYDAWICGGAIVTTEFIITSAACVEDVAYMYAIAGYSKYVSDEDLHSNPCTREMKKKIVYTCVPKAYHLDYEKVEQWAFIDIAVVKVESPYNFKDSRYETLCSYQPKAIQVNYEKRYQEPGIDGIVLGWGHASKWRMPNDTYNYNLENLHYAPILLADKEECKKQYMAYENILPVIDEYMICSMVDGNLNERGQLIHKTLPAADGCTSKVQKVVGFEGQSCEKDDEGITIIDREVRRKNTGENNTIEKLNIKIDEQNMTSSNNSNNTIPYEDFRRHFGICQNDHGGPVVTWIGSSEVMIGVASVFKVTKDMHCAGPFLYTSTQCNGAFLDCLLSDYDIKEKDNTQDTRKAFCDSSPEEKGFDIVESHISWKDHPDGPSANERG